MAPDHEADAFVHLQSDADRARWDAQTIGRLIGSIAHDFNNILTVIAGNLDLIHEAAKTDMVRRKASMALRAVERGSKVAAQLLAYARQEKLAPIEADLNCVIDASDTLLRQAVGGIYPITFQEAPDLWRAEIDPVGFISSLLNLLMNSRDAALPETQITIWTANVVVDEPRALMLGEIGAGRYAMVAVSDTGTGMDEATRRRAVEPFFTTRNDGRHSGLGLSQVYGFARQSNGQIEVSSAPGFGTTVRIFLPAPELQAQKKSGPEGPRVA